MGPTSRPVLDPQAPRLRFLPFFEAYISNFIEGTEFTVDEARAIVFEGAIPPTRPEDAHDILGTYRLVADLQEMRGMPSDTDDFLELIRARHRVIMEGRPEKEPGIFKSQPNRVGGIEFVAPILVEGTLRESFSHYSGLADPFARAVFQMFVVSAVHPFADGNGRIARIMMNAELVAADETRIIIPAVYRNNYLMGLRVMSTNRRPEALIRTLDFAQRYTAAIDFTTFDGAVAMLERTNAFRDPAEADAAGVRLVLPESSSTTTCATATNCASAARATSAWNTSW
jgi:Fic family protein